MTELIQHVVFAIPNYISSEDFAIMLHLTTLFSRFWIRFALGHIARSAKSCVDPSSEKFQ